jgi:hypothetical protein
MEAGDFDAAIVTQEMATADPEGTVRRIHQMNHGQSAPLVVSDFTTSVVSTVGALSNAAFVGSAILSFGIWSGAEAFHLPFQSGMTDLGPSVVYIFASLALFFAAAGSTWSVDSWLRPRLGAIAWLAAWAR